MKIKDLKKLLKEFDDEDEVLVEGDYTHHDDTNWELIPSPICWR